MAPSISFFDHHSWSSSYLNWCYTGNAVTASLKPVNKSLLRSKPNNPWIWSKWAYHCTQNHIYLQHHHHQNHHFYVIR
jgi:hypothetical protein